MDLETLKWFRDFCLKCFIVGFGIFIFGLVFYMIFYDWMTYMCVYIFDVDYEFATPVILGLFGFFEILVITSFLVPAAALHWQYKCALKKGR